ncbi:MAG: helix-turn-helix transcriptional regulator [Clostridiales bacterium]
MLEGFGKRLKTLREDKGLLQEELATAVGISLSSLRAYERIIDNSSKSKPPIDTIIKIADELNTSLDYLCRGKDEHLKEGNAVPVLRSLVDIMELFGVGIKIYSIPNELLGDVVQSAQLTFPNEFIRGVLFSPDEPSNIAAFINEYHNLSECGLRNIDDGLYIKTLDAFIEKWKRYDIHDTELYYKPLVKAGEPNGNDKKEE